MLRSISLALLSGCLCACDLRTVEDLQGSDVLTIEVCSDSSSVPCVAVADGRTSVPVRICTPVMENRSKDLKVTASLSSGMFVNPADTATPRKTTFSLYAERCADLRVVPGRRVEPIQIVATYADFHASANLPTQPTHIDALSLDPMPKALPGTSPSAAIMLKATLSGRNGGDLSEGTAVRFEVVDVQPAGATAFVLPERAAAVQDANLPASAQTVLTATPAVTAVTLRATAVLPPVEGVLAETNPTSATLTLFQLK